MRIAIYGARADRVTAVAAIADAANHEAFPFSREERFFDLLAAKPDVIGAFVVDDHVDGCELLIEWRRANLGSPILALLQERDTGANELARLIMAGADDARSLPCEPELLKACMTALARRLGIAEARVTKLPGGALYDPDAREIRSESVTIALTNKQAEIFSTLVAAAGRVVSRAQLMERLYGDQDEPNEQVLDVHVSKLRDRLRAVLDEVEVIESVWGAGWRFKIDGNARTFLVRGRAA